MKIIILHNFIKYAYVKQIKRSTYIVYAQNISKLLILGVNL